MGNVIKIGIIKNKGEKINSVDKIEAIKGKGLKSDRHYKENNNKECQLTLIESEHINEYNKISNTKIPYINFRRNIVTERINLNDLINKDFYIGNVKVRGHDLCRPCKHLEEMLNQKNIIKEFLRKGGLRCEILSTGTIFINDNIKY
tara:strand:- start:94 stop:534 length:441 start_codon:yes stop_codon:yes gene_type:complete